MLITLKMRNGRAVDISTGSIDKITAEDFVFIRRAVDARQKMGGVSQAEANYQAMRNHMDTHPKAHPAELAL